MANVKITGLTAITAPANTDVLPIVDVSADVTKKVSVADLLESAGDGTAALPAFAFDSDKDIGMYRVGANQLGFATAGTSRIVVDASGNVGITNATPGSFQAGGRNLVVGANTAENGITIYSTTSGNLYFADGTSGSAKAEGYIQYLHSSNRLDFGTSNSTRMSIDSSGRLLVGASSNTAPGGFNAKLQIADTSFTGSISMRRDSNNNSSQSLVFGKSRGSLNGNTIVQNGDKLGAIAFYGADGTDLNSEAASINAAVDGTPGSNDMPGRLVFSTTADGGSSPTERLRIDSSGNVGIGTQDPDKLLSLQNSTAPSLGLYTGSTIRAELKATSALTTFLSYSNSPITFNIGGSAETEALRIDGSGNVGIGTDAPTAFGPTLQVAGTDPCLLLQDTATAVDFFGTNITSGLVTNWYDDAAAWRIGTATGVAGSAYSEKMRIKANGNVGIGTDTPTAPLHVKRSSTSTSGLTDTLALQQGAATNGNRLSLTFASLDNHTVAGINGVIEAHAGSASNNVGRLEFYTKASGSSATERMRIDNSGNVGIGTVNPANTLHLSTTGTDGLRLGVDSQTYYNMIRPNGDGLYIGADDGNTGGGGADIRFNVKGGEKMRILSTGFVGIGTTSPQASLTIGDVNSSVEDIVVHASNNGNARLRFREGGSQASGFNEYSFGMVGNANALTFEMGGVGEAARINGDGKFMVGATSFLSGTNSFAQAMVSGAQGGLFINSTDTSATSYSRLMFTPNGHITGNEGLIRYNTNNYHMAFFTQGNEHMRILPSGHVKFTSGSGSYFNVAHTNNSFDQTTQGFDTLVLHANNASPYGIFMKLSAGSSKNNAVNYFMWGNDESVARFKVFSNGGIHNFSNNNVNLCDEREKKNIVSLDSKWDKVKSWELKKFHYNDDDDTDNLRYGVIAQQVETVCPEVLSAWIKQKAEDAILDEAGKVVEPAKEEIARKGVKEQQMMWMAIKALQEAMTKIETLEAKVAALEAG